MKRLIAIILALAMTAAITPAAFAGGGYDLTRLIAACGEPVFDGSTSASLADWGWEPQYESGMTVNTRGGENFIEFKKTDDYSGGGNLILSDSLYKATSAESCDFVILTFTAFSELPADRNENEHIYTLYAAKTNEKGKEILKFKYQADGLCPCTSPEQNDDVFGEAVCTSGTPVRVLFARDGGALNVIYQVYSGGWSTAYSFSADAARFSDGIGTIRDFVKFGRSGAATGLGNIKIYSGKFENVQEPSRYMEYLDRGLAVMKTDGGVYLSWRLLGDEEYDAAYEVRRNGEIIATVSDSTNYIDKDGAVEDEYTVAPAGGEPCAPKKAFPSGENYFDIPLSKPPAAVLPDGSTEEYSPWDATAGDLDGDGEYEIIQRWDASRRHAADSGFTGGLVLDAYKQDGTVLWRVDLGVNIRCNTENVFSVYDYNGDGIAELAAKTAPGSRDGTGRYVTEASLIAEIRNTDNDADYRDRGSGKVLDGPEFYTIFDGRNGKALDTIYYPIPRGDGQWGDRDAGWGHRGEKYFDIPAYLDGVHPYIVLWRGIYPAQDGSESPARTAVSAFKVENNRLRLEYSFDTMSGKPGYKDGNEQYVGQGNHNISVGDVDGDGLDEIVSGGLCLDNDLSVLWCSHRGHGDAQHLGNYDPTTEGLEFMTVHEHAPFGMSVYNAATGQTLGHWDAARDTGRGVMANVGSGGYYQLWGAGTYQCNGGNNFSETKLSGQSYNFRIFWDGDTYDELLDATEAGNDNTPSITSYNSETGKMDEIFKAWDSETVNTTKSTPALTADILGDWREELIAVREDYKALRVFVSPIYTENKVYTLMHDSQYRQSIAWEHQYYNQPPHIGFYLSGDNDQYDERKKKPHITPVKYDPMPYDAAVRVDNGVLEPPKVQDEHNIIDLDGDYFHSAEIISWQGGGRTVGNTTLTVSEGRYAFAAGANTRHSSIKNSWGLTAYDGKFISMAANGDERTVYTISGQGAAQSGRLHYDFSMPKMYTNYNGVLRERGGNDAMLRIGGDIALFYDRETTSLHFDSADGELIHTYNGMDDAQRWTALDADIDALGGNVRLKLTFPDGEVFEKDCAVSKRPIGDISFTTYYWGCILLDNVTLTPSGEGGEVFLSAPGNTFLPHSFNPADGRFFASFELVQYELDDGVIGFGGAEGEADDYSDLNFSIQLNKNGMIKARNNDVYSSSETVTTTTGEKYNIYVEGDIKKKIYSVYLTDENGVTRTVAKDYAFRSEAGTISETGSVYVLGGNGISGGKFAISSFDAGPVTIGITEATINDGTLTVRGFGKMTVWAVISGAAPSYRRLSFAESDRVKTIVLPEGSTLVRLFAWDDNLAPLSAPVEASK